MIEFVAWFTTFQSNSKLLMHYTDGVKGCGKFFDERLQAAFFNIIYKFSKKLALTKSPKIAKSLLHGFDCKFLARDFDLLSNKINVFNLLFRGGEA